METHSNWECSTVFGEQYTYSDDDFPSQETVACNDNGSSAEFLLQLDGIGLQLPLIPPMIAFPSLLDASFVISNHSACAGYTTVEISNNRNTSFDFQLVNGTCQLNAFVPSTYLLWTYTSTVVRILPNSSGTLTANLSSDCVHDAQGFCSYSLTWNTGSLPVSVPFALPMMALLTTSPPPAHEQFVALKEFSFSVRFSSLDYAYFQSPLFDNASFIDR